ncbi:MAG: metallophosphoesterase [Candidatus Bipolaricaulota bacterium]|nr:metallophosphoesterase [Candidatus Bipolaricaulota bacterium]MDW8030395.1 metallophosphoesterase [Candidatus Bipolaricaulota bacterium]
MRSVSLTCGLELVDLALFLPRQRALAIADVHLGIEDALKDEGILVPRHHLAQVQGRLERIFQELHVTPSEPLQKIIINGDLRHQFGPLSRTEHKESGEFLRWLARWAEQIVLVEGNHDGSLQQFQSEHITVTKSYSEGECWFVHGDEVLTPDPSPVARSQEGGARLDIEWVIIGHEHPAVGLRDPVTGRAEVYKCFLVGTFREYNLLVLPSFNQLVRGSDLLKEQALSPLVQQSDLEEFSVYVVSDDGSIYEFGPLRRLLISL